MHRYRVDCDTVIASPAHTSPATCRYFVEGMDCADCARTVQSALGRLPGVRHALVNFTTQALELSLDEQLTTRAELEQRLRSLGYPPVLQSADSEAAPVSTTAPWYRTPRGRTVLTTGSLLLTGAVLALVYPPLAAWGFIAATLIGAWPLARKAWASTRLGEPFTINTLVSVAAIGAVIIGEAPEGALVVFFFAIGELLESVAAGRARASIQALAALAPKTAFLSEDGRIREVPAESLLPGQLVQVRPGGRIPADGTIESGSANVDVSPVTGESVPVHKTRGDAILAGSISTDAVLDIRVERPAKDSTIARIIHLVEEAESNKAPVARFIDRFSRAYTPAALLFAILIAIIPPLLFGADWGEWTYRGIAILLIACPCALVLSVPAAVTSGISAGARNGLLIKGGAALEAFGSVTTVAFDKTGTLTENWPLVTDVIALNASEQDVVRLAAATEAGSAHPLAKAVMDRAAGLKLPAAENARAIAGKAVTATINNRSYAVGSPRYASEHTRLPPQVEQHIGKVESVGKTVVVLLEETVPLGLLAIRDEPRQDAQAAISRLGKLGIRSVMLTGDNARTGSAIASSLGLTVHAELLPGDKLRLIRELGQTGPVAMVGDGINDAPALAQADVSIAMGSGSDVALETADAALLQERVTGVSDLVELSRATMRNIRQNVTFALGLKAVFLVITLLGITGLWPAILSDTGATVIVTANALRLLNFRPQPVTYREQP